MLSDQQVDHFRTFGFVVLRRYLDERETAELGREMDRAHRDAFGARFDERPDEGAMPGHYLPMMSRQRTPVSLGLVEDPRFLGAAGQLVGPAVVPTYAEGILLFDQAGFHDDAGPGVKAVKFVAYLEPLIAATGALRLLPGSHLPEFSASLVGWRQRNRADDAEQLRRQVDGLPLYVAETRPGDVIAFNWHTWHTSIRGRDRRQWTVSYVRDPATAEETERFKDIVIDSGLALLDDEPGYDRAAYPLYDEHWLAPEAAQTERVLLSKRMPRAGHCSNPSSAPKPADQLAVPGVPCRITCVATGHAEIAAKGGAGRRPAHRRGRSTPPGTHALAGIGTGIKAWR